jgi:hypothetical protein
MTHFNGCPNFSCVECGMMAGSHGVECSRNIVIDALAPAIEHDESARTKTEVDGEEAVIDGRTGGVKERPLIESADSDDAVLAHLARCVEKEARLRTAANRAKNALSKAHKETEAAQQHAAEHYARSRQLVMDLTTGGTDPEEDE